MAQKIPNFPYIEENDGINEIELDETEEDLADDSEDGEKEELDGGDNNRGADNENSEDEEE